MTTNTKKIDIDKNFYLSNKAEKMFYSLIYWRLCQVVPTTAPMSLVVLTAIAKYLKVINPEEEKTLLEKLSFEQYYDNLKQRIIKQNSKFTKRFIKLADKIYKDDIKLKRDNDDLKIASEIGLCFYDYFLHEVNDLEYYSEFFFD